MGNMYDQLARKIAPHLVPEAISDHATTHEDGGDDEIAAEDLATALTAGQVLVGGGSGDLVAGDIENISTALTAGQVLVADGAGGVAAGVAEDIGTALTAGQVLASDGAGALVAAEVEGIATALADGQGLVSDGAGALQAARAIQTYISGVIDHTDLGAGASTDETLSPAFPDNVMVGPARLVVTETFAGEGDIAVLVGDAGDPDGKIASVALDGVAPGYVASVGGAESGFRFEADYTPVARFTATELSDLTAGKVKIAIDYYLPDPAETA